MAGVPLIGAISSLGSALAGGLATYFGDKQLADAQRYATGVQNDQFNATKSLLQPQIAAGDTARSYELGALGLPGGVTYQDAVGAFKASPDYKFRLQQGINGAETSAAASGNLFSGGTLKNLADYSGKLASGEFNNWLSGLGGLSGAGGTAAGSLATAGTNYANSLGSLAMTGANSRASSYATGANTLTSGLQNLSDLWAYYNRTPTAALPTVQPGSGYFYG